MDAWTELLAKSQHRYLKAAYEWDQPSGEPNRNALFIQTAMGF